MFVIRQKVRTTKAKMAAMSALFGSGVLFLARPAGYFPISIGFAISAASVAVSWLYLTRNSQLAIPVLDPTFAVAK